MKVDQIEVCKPVESLVNLLISYGFEIVESKVNDYHFHELKFTLKGSISDIIDTIKIDKIQSLNEAIFTCSCHWTSINLIKNR